MAFPAPKPRNIEKDVKVFHWKDLSSALEKIISKYSASPSSNLRPALPTLSSDHPGRNSSRQMSDVIAPMAQNSMSAYTQVLSSHRQKSKASQDRCLDLDASISGDALDVQTSHSSPSFPNSTRDLDSSFLKHHQVLPSLKAQENHIPKLSSTPQAGFSPECDTSSSIMEDESEWGEHDVKNCSQLFCVHDCSSAGLGDQVETNGKLMAAILSPFKKELIDRLMQESWVIIKRENESLHATNFQAGLTSSFNSPVDMVIDSGSHSKSNPGHGSHACAPIPSCTLSGSISEKHQRDDQDGQDGEAQDDGDKRGSQRTRTQSPPQSQDGTLKFGCPFRMRDASIHSGQDWRSCTMTPLSSMAAVKQHLYRHHRIFNCPRCQVVFMDLQAVNMHLREPKGCELRRPGLVEGVTSEMYERLRSEEKVRRGQTEAERWEDMYEVLFPDELIPSPYFAAVQGDRISSHNPRQLADCEEYCSRELPREFRAALEEIIDKELRPIDERIRQQLTGVVKDCQDRVFSGCQSMVELEMEARAAPSTRVPEVLEGSWIQLEAGPGLAD